MISDDELAALLKAGTGKEFNDRRDEAMIGCCWIARTRTLIEREYRLAHAEARR